MSKVDNMSIRQIGEEVVLEKYSGTEENVTIPEGVTVIGKGAFKFCNNLKSVAIPNSVKRIEWGAFSYTGLRSVKIPESVLKLERYAFAFCGNLASVELPKNIEMAGTSFMNCHKLADEDGFVIVNDILYNYIGQKTDVAIPNGVRMIGESVFRFQYIPLEDGLITQSETIESIFVPESVTTVSKDAILKCPNLKKVVFAGEVAAFGVGDDYSKDEIFTDCAKDLKVIVPHFDIINGQCSEIRPLIAMQYMCNRDEYKDRHPNYARYCISQKRNLIKRAAKDDVVAVMKYYAEENIITPENVDKDFIEVAKKANAIECVRYLEKWKADNGAVSVPAEPVDYALEIKKQIAKKFKCNVEDLKSVPWDEKFLKDGKEKIEVVEIPPRNDYPYRTLFSVGIGKFDMATSVDSKKRMEFMVTIPEEENATEWANDFIYSYSELDFSKGFYSYGHTIHYTEAISDHARSFLLLKGINEDKKVVNFKVDGKTVNLLRLFPLYESEWRYLYLFARNVKQEMGLFDEKDLLSPVNKNRKGFC